MIPRSYLLQDYFLKLPPELRTQISNYVLQSAIEGPSFRRFSDPMSIRTSIALVCKEFCHAIRPLPFEGLELSCARDVSFLRQILHSDLSGWLRFHIRDLRYTITYNARHPIAGEAFAILLSPQLLPSLKRLTLNNFFRRDYAFVTQLRRRLTQLTSLTHLHLQTIKPFPSFSVLCRLLGSIPSLEDVELCDITWKASR